jgi:O-methyltransferase involved in polyketide biosynthesis
MGLSIAAGPKLAIAESSGQPQRLTTGFIPGQLTGNAASATVLERATATLDLTKPAAVIMLGILPFIGDDEEARGIVARLLAPLPAGSYLAVTHSTSEVSGERVIEAVRQWNAVAPAPYTLRSPAQIAAF